MKIKISIVILITFFLSITGCSNSSSNIESYLNTGTSIDSKAKDVMPSLEDLPEYTNIEYRYTQNSIYVFKSHSFVLIVEYNDDIFESGKKKLDE